MKKIIVFFLLLYASFTACNNTSNQNNSKLDSTSTEKKIVDVPVTTSVKIISPEALQLIDSTAVVQELGKGFMWSEGPVWVESLNALLFSDVPANKMYKWTEKDGISLFLTPSGFTDTSKVKKGEGSNGLVLDSEGDLVLCQHGDRRIAALKSGLQNPKPTYITLADKYNGKRFNSPNDLVIKSNGEIYFTDPPFGIKDQKDKELKINGVFKVNQNGEVSLLVDTIEMPNGLAFSPDEKTMYIGNCTDKKAIWYSYQVDAKNNLTKPAVFFNETSFLKDGPGLPDGIKVHKNGTVFATGPGGVFILSPKGKLIGKICTSKSTANLAFDKEYKYLYLTTTDRLLRVKLK